MVRRCVLGLLPWTRGSASRLLEYVLDPLGNMGRGIVNAIPDLIFLAILFFVTRYLLKLIHLFFGAVGRGEVTLSGFNPEWAEPTFKLMRVGIIVFGLVVAARSLPWSLPRYRHSHPHRRLSSQNIRRSKASSKRPR